MRMRERAHRNSKPPPSLPFSKIGSGPSGASGRRAGANGAALREGGPRARARGGFR